MVSPRSSSARRWVYDPAGNVLNLTTPETNPSAVLAAAKTYDQMNRVRTAKDPMGRTTTFGYCPCGALESVTDAKGQITTIDHYLNGLDSKKTYPGGSYQSYIYDECQSSH